MGRGSRWEDGGHTPAPRRASARGLWSAPELGAGWAPEEGEGPAVQQADAREQREDACELRVACTVALLTSGSLAAGGFAEAPGRERGQVA